MSTFVQTDPKVHNLLIYYDTQCQLKKVKKNAIGLWLATNLLKTILKIRSIHANPRVQPVYRFDEWTWMRFILYFSFAKEKGFRFSFSIVSFYFGTRHSNRLARVSQLSSIFGQAAQIVFFKISRNLLLKQHFYSTVINIKQLSHAFEHILQIRWY